MSNRPRQRPRRSYPTSRVLTPLQRYEQNLRAAGRPAREVTRAVFYAERYGLESLDGYGCVTFDEPTCSTGWNCLNPEHQVLRRDEVPS